MRETHAGRYGSAADRPMGANAQTILTSKNHYSIKHIGWLE